MDGVIWHKCGNKTVNAELVFLILSPSPRIAWGVLWKFQSLTLWFLFMRFCIKAAGLAAIPAGMWDIRWLCLLIVALLLLFGLCSTACISSAGGDNA